MGFLLAKMVFLLALAAAAGGLFSYWWFRRHYEDVTLEYTRSRAEWSSWRRTLEERLSARPEVDLSPLSLQMQAVEDAVRGLPQAERVNLTPLMEAIATLHLPMPERLDLAPLQARLDDIGVRLGELRVPAASGAEGITERLAALEAGVKRLPERTASADLGPLEKRLMAIEHALFPVQTRLDGLESAVRAARGDSGADLSPLLEQLAALRAHLEGAAAKPVVREGSRNLLDRPAEDKPDDLTRLKGVDKVLERTLHRVGVFYFWQIAEWSPEDVEYVDSQLPRFKGRIARDGWVEQAHELAAEPDAAPAPTAH
jgi:predicted flap endonuclease-1-like 5' DNA nuclease